MNEIKRGMKAINFEFNTPWSNKKYIFDEIDNKKTVLLFLRFYGCRISQLDMSKLEENYHNFIELNSQVFIVLQTDPFIIRERIKKNDLPFTIICDPEHKIYKLYGVKSSNKKVINQNYIDKLNEAKKKGFIKIPNNNKEIKTQLPASFIINSRKEIEHVKYGSDSGDILSIDKLLSLL